MSATATVPPPSNSSLLRNVPRLTARARALLTAINLHYAGVAALLVIVLYMVAHLLFLSRVTQVAQCGCARPAAHIAHHRAPAGAAAARSRLKDHRVHPGRRRLLPDRLPYAYSQVLCRTRPPHAEEQRAARQRAVCAGSRSLRCKRAHGTPHGRQRLRRLPPHR